MQLPGFVIGVYKMIVSLCKQYSNEKYSNSSTNNISYGEREMQRCQQNDDAVIMAK